MGSWQCTGCARISYDAPGYGTNRGLPHGVAGVMAPTMYFVWGADSAHGVHVFRMMRGVMAPIGGCHAGLLGLWHQTCISYEGLTVHMVCMGMTRRVMAPIGGCHAGLLG